MSAMSRPSAMAMRFLAQPGTVNFGAKVHGGTMMSWSVGLDTTAECAIVMVAVDSRDKPVSVEPFVPEGDAAATLVQDMRRRLGPR